MELKPCSKCGGKAVKDTSIGGFTIYYGIYCLECGHSNRTHNSSMFSHGLGGSGGYPPTNYKQSIEEWNKEYDKSELSKR